MNILLKRMILLVVFAVIAVPVFWFVQFMWYGHVAKQAVLTYLHNNYKGLDFKITEMHQGFFGTPGSFLY